MPPNDSRPIRPSGWAFRLSDLRRWSRSHLALWSVAAYLTLTPLPFLSAPLAVAQYSTDATQQDAAHEAPSGHEHHGLGALTGAWEGSAAGIAYSEFNHHVAGFLLVVIGCAELIQALRASSPLWARLLLPGALGLTGLFLLIWSDHEAWPIGSMSLWDTLYGGDHEILQHKLYGVLALVTSTVEILRRAGLFGHAGWMVPLPAFAIIGGWMLFSHSHGAHPAAHKIALHHAIMGTLAITAGSSRLVSAWKAGASATAQSWWERLWAGLILLIGIQLIFYSE